MGNRIRRLADVILILLVVLSGAIVYWQLVRGDELLPMTPGVLVAQAAVRGPGSEASENPADDLNQQIINLLSNGAVPVDLSLLPQPLVQRTRDLLADITRGTIYDRSGQPLAYDEVLPGDTEPTRRYVSASLAHAIGYTSGLRIGIAGLERSYNGTLLGLHRLDAQVGRMLRQPIHGSDMVLTIDAELQQAAAQALQGQRGAIVVLDGRDGAVLALVSAPDFDPNQMLDPAYTAGLSLECSAANCPAPLVNRATQGRYTPGSIWKTLTLIAGLDSGRLQPGMIFDFGKPVQGPDGPYFVYTVDGGTIPDPNHKESRLSLELSYAKSANAAFARIGDEMGAPIMIDYAKRLGLSEDGDSTMPFDLPTVPPQLAADVGTLQSNNLLRAATAIGQGELLDSPLAMARMVLAVLNDGSLPLPYLVHSLHDPSGDSDPGPMAGRRLDGLMRPETAREVQRMMQIVIQDGSGGRAAVPGLTVGGKTGTAQLGGGQAPHAWFTGFAGKGEQRVVIVVLVENSGEGSQVAAPIFAALAPLAIQAAARPIQPPPAPIPSESSDPQATPADVPADAPTTTPEAQAPGVPPAPTALPAALPTPPLPSPTPAVPLPPESQAALSQPDIPYDPERIPFYIKTGPSCPLKEQRRTGSGNFAWPSNYQQLSGGDFLPEHPGIDLGAPDGSPVFASDAGMVVFSGWSGQGYGNVVVIDHGNGFWTLYAHLSSVAIPCGSPVKQTQRIGLSGSTGNSTGDHLHFELRNATGYINPLRVLPVP